MTRLLIPVALLMVIVLVSVFLSSIVFPSVRQPIAFNHLLHVEEVGAECTDCHLYAEAGRRATIPNVETCSLCHEESSTGSEDEARLLRHVHSEDPIPWLKIYRIPEHVNFSHRMHTAIGGIACETCHGQVGARSDPVTQQFIPITMDGCMACHEQEGASNDCIACHT